MLFFRSLRPLALATVATLFLLPTQVHAASKSKSKAKSKSTVTATAKKPAKKIDLSKLETVPSLREKESKQKPEAQSGFFLGFLASRYRYDSRMLRAAEIASSRAYAHSRGSCWRYVKNALVSAGVIDSRPTTAYAKEAAQELTSEYGFKKVGCSDPFKAPPGSVLVYGGAGAGHIEFRTKTGFVSDFSSVTPSKRPLIGVYVKP
jgi:hypothetical protein